MPARRPLAIIFFVFAFIALGVFYQFGRPIWVPLKQRLSGGQTVDDVLAKHGERVRPIWSARIQPSGVAYPPRELTLLAFKQERLLEVWVPTSDAVAKIAEYDILAASGTLGPKLREGDNQVPEGIYAIEGLNPNSAFHLSIKLDYPNTFDLARAADEGRDHPGSNIFIHGKRASIGCLAIGDPAIEELFVLVADVGRENVQVILAPCDFRAGCAAPASDLPWVPGLYEELRSKLATFASIE